MTMEGIAKIAGVSVSTVSKAFSGSKEISAAKREHIFDIAKKEGCYDKFLKRTYPKKVIAVIYPEYKSGYYSEQLDFLTKEIESRDAVMISATTAFDKERTEELIEFFSGYVKADGIVVCSSFELKRKYSLPIVSIGGNEDVSSIKLSNETAIHEAVAYLVENGHSDIAFIGETHTTSKRIIFESAMENLELDVKKEYIAESELRFEEAGYEGMELLFGCERLPTAVIAAYDSIAIGAMRSISEHNLKIPEDISIIGMDNIKATPYLNVPLTSITSYNEDLCQIALDMLFEALETGNNNNIKNINVSSELIKRESVGAVSKRKK